jgi:hypothetical protein
MNRISHVALVMFLFLLVNRADAQTTFAPAGSEWYHSQSLGVFHSYYASDTVIAGISCRKIIREALTKDPYYSQGARVQNLNTLFVYTSGDTVLLYNDFFHRFTPLYIFDVNDGDTLHLPIIPLDVANLTQVSNDSTFSMRVDSVRMKLYDTATLKTIYVHALGDPDSNYVYSFSDDIFSAYAERIGGLASGLLPRGNPSTIILDDNLQLADSIRCYNDPSMSLKMTPGICGIPPVDVPATVFDERFKLFPNPAHDEITVAASHELTALTVMDVVGNLMYSQSCAAKSIHLDISGWSNGVYFLRTNSSQIVKFTKQ